MQIDAAVCETQLSDISVFASIGEEPLDLCRMPIGMHRFRKVFNINLEQLFRWKLLLRKTSQRSFII